MFNSFSPIIMIVVMCILEFILEPKLHIQCLNH